MKAEFHKNDIISEWERVFTDIELFLLRTFWPKYLAAIAVLVRNSADMR